MSRHHKGAAWERVRQDAFTQHGRRCQECGLAGRLEVHHKVSVQHGGTDDMGNLRILCRGCHIEAHRPKVGEQERAWQALVGEIRNR